MRLIGVVALVAARFLRLLTLISALGLALVGLALLGTGVRLPLIGLLLGGVLLAGRRGGASGLARRGCRVLSESGTCSRILAGIPRRRITPTSVS